MSKPNEIRSISNLWHSVKDYFFQLIDLKEDTDQQGTIDSIEKYIQIRGYNVWILIAAAMIASIGLDNNAPAIIIGAMLISPLMSPILGIGLGIGINDRQMLRDAFQNFFLAVVISIITSWLYFYCTPLGSPTNELLSRTQPTLLDALVALFGGIAGIVAGSRTDKTNAIPGVAIATALMPPLCTAGYGLAMSNWVIFGGALYLFFINAAIIASSTYMIVRFLNFPLKEYANPAEKRRTTFSIAVFVSLMLIPSIFILKDTLERIRTNSNIKSFVEKEINGDIREALRWQYIKNDSIPELKVFLVGDSFPTDTIDILKATLQKYDGLQNTELELIQFDVSQEEKERMSTEITDEVSKVAFEVNKQLKLQKQELDSLISLRRETRPPIIDSALFGTIQMELKSIYPELDKIAASEAIEVDYDDLKPENVDTTKALDSLLFVAQGDSANQFLANIDSIPADTFSQKQTTDKDLEASKMRNIKVMLVSWKESADSSILDEHEKRIANYIKMRMTYEKVQIQRY